MGLLTGAFWFVLMIGALVFFHELGHFLVAKAVGIKVLRFAIGFGPRLVGFRRGDTDYCLCALPLGGYVKMLGEAADAEVAAEDLQRSFQVKPVWQRSVVLFAGPAFNVLLAVVIYVGMFTGQQTFADTRLGVVSVGDAAWEAGLRPGDKVVAVDGTPVERWSQLRDLVGARPGQRVDIVYEREGERRVAPLQPRVVQERNDLMEQEARGRIGVSFVYLKPILAVVDPDSPAAAARLRTRDVIEAVNGKSVAAWHEVRSAVEATPIGEPVQLRIVRGEGDERTRMEVSLTPQPWLAGIDRDLFSAADTSEGYTGLAALDSVVESVDAGSPAAAAGISPGDRLLSVRITHDEGAVETRLVGSWGVDLAAVQASGQRTGIVVTLQRGHEVIDVAVNLAEREVVDELKNKTTVRVFGVNNHADASAAYLIERRVGLPEAVREAVAQVGQDMTFVARSMGKLIGGSIPLDSMGGPIMLFVLADKAAEKGLLYYLRTLALISVNLGLLNLLPIPVLDGGHLVFCGIEAVWRKPPSVRVREWANMVGLALLLLLMVFVFRNDIVRYVLS